MSQVRTGYLQYWTSIYSRQAAVWLYNKKFSHSYEISIREFCNARAICTLSYSSPPWWRFWCVLVHCKLDYRHIPLLIYSYEAWWSNFSTISRTFPTLDSIFITSKHIFMRISNYNYYNTKKSMLLLRFNLKIEPPTKKNLQHHWRNS